MSLTSLPLLTPPSSLKLFPSKNSTLKLLSYKDHLKLAMTEIQKKAGTHQSIAAKFGINRTILKARLDEKPTWVNKAISQHLFTLSEEQAIINFINKATKFGFLAKLYIVKDKAMLLLAL